MSQITSAERACALYEQALRAPPAEALRLARRALALFVRCDGPASGDAANVLLAISAAEQALGRYARSFATAMRAWRILAPVRSRQLEIRRLRANACGRLAAIALARGDYADAIWRSRRALAIAETLEDADVVSAAMLLGVASKHAGEYAGAERAYARVAARLPRGASATRATLLHNLGGLAHARGRFAAGARLARRGIAMRERLVGRAHPDVGEDLAALAPLLDGMGDASGAVRVYRRARRILERHVGPRHLEVGLLLANLAACEHRRGRLAEAERGYRSALAIVRARVGPTHPHLAIIRAHLALLGRARARGR